MEKNTEDSKTEGITAEAIKKAIDSEGSIDFDYIKSNQFRVIHTDGVHGGLSPNGKLLQMAIFSERSPIPQKETFRLKAGKILDKISVQKRDTNVIREVEVELLMSMETAKSVCKWMDEKIRQIEKIQGEFTKI